MGSFLSRIAPLPHPSLMARRLHHPCVNFPFGVERPGEWIHDLDRGSESSDSSVPQASSKKDIACCSPGKDDLLRVTAGRHVGPSRPGR